MSAIDYLTLVNIQCYSCGVTFGLEQSYQQTKRNNHSSFYCPNGHAQHYPGKTEQEKEIERLKQEVRNVTVSRDYHRDRAEEKQREAETAKRSAAASRGVVTRIKKRITKGVCPCCRRYFRDLHQHMQGQHPDWKNE